MGYTWSSTYIKSQMTLVYTIIWYGKYTRYPNFCFDNCLLGPILETSLIYNEAAFWHPIPLAQKGLIPNHGRAEKKTNIIRTKRLKEDEASRERGPVLELVVWKYFTFDWLQKLSPLWHQETRLKMTMTEVAWPQD